MAEKTSGWVTNDFDAILVTIGSPDEDLKPRGKSSGWSEGKNRTRRPRLLTVEKTYSKPKSNAKTAA